MVVVVSPNVKRFALRRIEGGSVFPFHVSSTYVKLRTTSFSSCSARRVASRCGVPVDVEKLLLLVVSGERKKVCSRCGRKGTHPYARAFCAYGTHRARFPKACPSLARIFNQRRSESVKFRAVFVRFLPVRMETVATRRNPRTCSPSIEKQIQSVVPLNYTECPSQREKKRIRDSGIVASREFF